jgi:hypothetical protein
MVVCIIRYLQQMIARAADSSDQFIICRARLCKSDVVPARQVGNRFLGSLKCLQIRALVSATLVQDPPPPCIHFFLQNDWRTVHMRATVEEIQTVVLCKKI